MVFETTDILMYIIINFNNNCNNKLSNLIVMRIYKAIKEGKVSNHYDLKKATMNRPDIVFAQKGLIVPTRWFVC